jgi:hypothetical protein
VDVSAVGAELADAVASVLGTWIAGCIARFGVRADIGPVIADAEAEVLGDLRALLATDIDDQRGTPLTVLRRAVRFPTALLAAAGVPAVDRDPYDAQAFPEDVYGLSPATWADVDPSLADPGLRWSVAKAFEHRRRHRSA